MLNRNQPIAASAGISAGSSVPRPRLFPGRAALVVIAVGAYAAYMLSGSVQCSFAAITHHPCPACGGTRSIHALMHGDVMGSLHYNPIAPLFVIVLGALAIRAVIVVGRDGNLYALGHGFVGVWMVRALVLALSLELMIWVLRFFGLFGGPVAV